MSRQTVNGPVTWDCIIIGAGLAGLTCGIVTASGGLRTLIISGGMSALHFASGSIDLLGYDSRGKTLTLPLKGIPDLLEQKPLHPYKKTGTSAIIESLMYFRDTLAGQGVNLFHHEHENHLHMTALGTLKPTFLSGITSYNEKFREAFLRHDTVALLTFKGYRDFYPDMAAARLAAHPAWKSKINTGTISLPYYTNTRKNLHEFRSVDLARVFDSERYLPRIADEICAAAGDAPVVIMPAFIGIDNFARVHRRLEDMTGKLICEIPALPPSLPGMRIDNALKRRFAELGGELSSGDRAVGAEIEDGRVTGLYTVSGGKEPLRTRFAVLSTGSFFSGGLRASSANVSEPVFKLAIHCSENRKNWSSDSFFSKKGHPFLEFGVLTDSKLRGLDAGGKAIRNLFCAGSVLAGYDPVREGSGGGVSITTGYTAGKRILQQAGEKE